MGILKPSVNSTNASGDMKLQTLTLSSRNSSNQYKERRRKGGEGQKERMKLKNENGTDGSYVLIRLSVYNILYVAMNTAELNGNSAAF